MVWLRLQLQRHLIASRRHQSFEVEDPSQGPIPLVITRLVQTPFVLLSILPQRILIHFIPLEKRICVGMIFHL